MNEYDGEILPKTVLQYCCQRDFSTVKKITKISSDWSRLSVTEISNAFVKMCNACTGFCDFSSQEADYTQKIIKIHLIEDIKEAIETAKYAKGLTRESLQCFVDMFNENIFSRPFVSLSFYANFYSKACNSDDFVVRNLEWPHLDPIYKCFESFLGSNCIRPACITSFLTKDFIHNLFEVLKHSPDKREQTAVCSLLLTIGTNFPSTQTMIHKESTEFLIISQYDVSVQYSLSSFFEFFAVWTTIYKPREKKTNLSNSVGHFRIPVSSAGKNSSLTSFSLLYTPLSCGVAAARQKYLIANILPLSMIDTFESFEDSFTDTVCAFISTDKKNADVFVDYMLKHWPIRSTKKQVVFFDSMMKVVTSFSKYLSNENISKVVRHTTRSFNDSTTQISQTALRIVTGKGFQSIISSKWNVFGPLTYKSAQESLNNHWSQETKDLASKVMKSLEKINPNVNELLNDSSLNNSGKEEVVFLSSTEEKEENARKETWSIIKSMAMASE